MFCFDQKTGVPLGRSPLTSAASASSALRAVSSSTLTGHSWSPACIVVANFSPYLQASTHKYVRGRKSASFWRAVFPTWKVIKTRLIQTRRNRVEGGGWSQSQRPMLCPLFWEVIYLMVANKCQDRIRLVAFWVKSLQLFTKKNALHLDQGSCGYMNIWIPVPLWISSFVQGIFA